MGQKDYSKEDIKELCFEIKGMFEDKIEDGLDPMILAFAMVYISFEGVKHYTGDLKKALHPALSAITAQIEDETSTKDESNVDRLLEEKNQSTIQ